jgi:S-adenosylmethionine synthetase
MNSPVRNIIVEEQSGSRHEECRVEMCEHRGVGHPDTITDGGSFIPIRLAFARHVALALES